MLLFSNGPSCSSLSSVEPPQVWFDLKLPKHVVEEVALSSLQLEGVVYACQQHMNILSDGSRAGFLIGKCVHPQDQVQETSVYFQLRMECTSNMHYCSTLVQFYCACVFCV